MVVALKLANAMPDYLGKPGRRGRQHQHSRPSSGALRRLVQNGGGTRRGIGRGLRHRQRRLVAIQEPGDMPAAALHVHGKRNQAGNSEEMHGKTNRTRNPGEAKQTLARLARFIETNQGADAGRVDVVDAREVYQQEARAVGIRRLEGALKLHIVCRIDKALEGQLANLLRRVALDDVLLDLEG